MIKICSPQLGLSPVSSLGGEIYDYQTIKGYVEKGIKVFVYLPKGRLYDKSLKKMVVQQSFLKHIVPPIIYSFICLPYLFRTYRVEKFDILRIHVPRFLGLAGLIFNYFYPKVPILVSVVNVDDISHYYLIEKMILQKANKIIVQSEYMKKRTVKRFGISPSKIEVTFGGQIRSEKYKKKPIEAKKIYDTDKVILFMGWLIGRKNPLFAYEVFKKCLNKEPNLKFVIIGNGLLKSELIKKVEYDNLADKVIFKDSAYGEEKAYFLSRADLVLVPSLDEGFGLIVTEAMSYKKVVIASNIEVFQEIISNGKDGFLLPLNKKQIWVDKIIELIRNKKIIQEISNNAKIKVERKFNWERTFDLNKKVVQELVYGKQNNY